MFEREKEAYRQGLRIQVQASSASPWIATDHPAFYTDYRYRIHPDDKPKFKEQIDMQENTKRHKHADIIIAWANGEPVQWRYDYVNHPDDGWKDYPTTLGSGASFSDDRLQWRIKPKTKTV